MRLAHTAALLALAAWPMLAGCARRAPDATPEGALDLYLRTMEETPYDPQATGRAFRLLSPKAREAIKAESARAQQITGKPLPVEAFFTPTWRPLRFPVDRLHAVIAPDGEHAMVDVYGVDAKADHVRVPMVREGEGWRLEIDIPPSAPEPAPSVRP
jgi:hypothetical protein